MDFFHFGNYLCTLSKTHLLLDSFSFKEKSISAQELSKNSASNKQTKYLGWVSKFAQLLSAENYPRNILSLIKAELLQLKPHPFICMRSFINKKVGN